MKLDFNSSVLAKALDLRLERHGALASNIANADTPGYRPRAVSFEDQLQQAAQSRNHEKVRNISSKIEIVDDGPPRLDGNSVNLDKQMGEMTENTVGYNATAEFLKRKISMLKMVMS